MAMTLKASQATRARFAAIACLEERKACHWNEFNDLCKQVFGDIHRKF
jgi:hypothetical protein